MAKSPSPKQERSEESQGGTFAEAMKALEGVGVPNQKFGQLNEDGTVEIDLNKLEALKKKLGKAAWTKVRFVALNAPFKRRSPIPRLDVRYESRFVNIAAELTLKSLRAHGGAAWPHYRDALITACRKAPPPFGTKDYEKIYRDVARDPGWMAISLIQNAQGEGEGSGHLWDLAASTPDERVAAMVKAHAIDESRHAKSLCRDAGSHFPGRRR